jgi:tRNA-dihydrouridine synthase B
MIELQNRALLAPMSGITDLPFRRLVHRMGAGLVIAEMVASKMLAGEHKQTLQRVMGSAEISPYVIQISGRDPVETAEAAKVAADLGADMIDINMGCPARKVIKGLAGSALMKQPDLALSIIESVVNAVDVPVSLKMRLGWDENLLNAADIAIRAEQAGIQMFTVHGRTRNQFYKGRADWIAIRKVVKAVDVPVIANGDILTFSDVETCLKQSGAYGVMIGRGAQGRPWIVGEFGKRMATKIAPPTPSIPAKKAIILEHYEDVLGFYGIELGLRNARKHLGWYVDDLFADQHSSRNWRSRLCREDNPANVKKMIGEMFVELENDQEAAA